MIEITSIAYDKEELKAEALSLASILGLEVEQNSSAGLFLTAEKLSLKMPSFNLMAADFSSSFWCKRKLEGKKQGLVRACKPHPGLKIIDATAGWGRDSAILASLGAEVLMIERNPIMAALLKDALARRSELDASQMQLSLYQGNALAYLDALSPQDYPDVIYIDPMHPARNKAALVKKEMQVLQELIGPDEDALELINKAILRSKNRVIVKWPQKIKPLIQSSASIEGKTVRFDIYTSSQ